MWAVIGVWDIDPGLIETIRGQIPLMASSKTTYPGFVHGVWTMDAHAILAFTDEESARHYYDSVLEQGAVDRPGIRSIRWDVTEVGAESDTTGWTDRAGGRHTTPVPDPTG